MVTRRLLPLLKLINKSSRILNLTGLARGFLRSKMIGPEKAMVHESGPGPVQLTLPLDRSLTVQRAEAHLDGEVYEGVLDAGKAVFLLPYAGHQEQSVRIVLRTRDGKLVERSVTAHAVPGNGSTPEQPYELREARRLGLVLKRDQIYGSGPPNEQPDRNTLEFLLKYGGSPSLDVGCGIGTYVEALSKKGIRSCGLEVRADCLDTAERHGRKVDLYDGATIPYGDRSFDTVLAVEVLEHVEDWKSLLNEMVRVSSRRVLVTTPNIGVLCGMAKHGVVPWHILEATHVNFFTIEAWRKWILNTKGVHGFVFPFGDLSLNGEIFKIHLFVLIEKDSN